MEEHRHVQKGREENSLHQLGVVVDSVTTEYCKNSEDTTTIFIASDKNGYVFSANGSNAEDIAKALMGAATKEDLVAEALKHIIKDVLKELALKQ